MADATRQTHERILFVANRACGNPGLCAAVRAHAGRAAEVLVVAPVLGSTLHRWTNDDAEDRPAAEERVRETVRCLSKHDLRADGMLGDPDPVQAIEDALHGFPADEIVICLEEPERARWFHEGVVERTKKRFAVPVTEIAVSSTEPAHVP